MMELLERYTFDKCFTFPPVDAKEREAIDTNGVCMTKLLPLHHSDEPSVLQNNLETDLLTRLRQVSE
jgi:hypothetical protein